MGTTAGPRPKSLSRQPGREAAKTAAIDHEDLGEGQHWFEHFGPEGESSGHAWVQDHPGHVWVKTMQVSPPERGKGVGGSLLDHIQRHFGKPLRLKPYPIGERDDDPDEDELRDWYGRRGFTDYRRQPGDDLEAHEWMERHGAGEILRNPSTNGREWYHGTRANSEQLAGGFRMPEADPDPSWPAHWSTGIGVHFAAHHSMANKFADPSHGIGGKGGAADPEHSSTPSVVHARLHIANPKVYADEDEMADDAFEHEHGQRKNYISKYIKADDERVPYAAPDYFSFDHHPHEAPSRGEYENFDDWEDHAEWGEERPAPVYRREQWLNLHPDQAGIAKRFRERLQAEGHDGIVYRNSAPDEQVRSSKPESNQVAIAFHPSQIETTKHHVFGDEHKTAAAEPQYGGYAHQWEDYEEPTDDEENYDTCYHCQRNHNPHEHAGDQTFSPDWHEVLPQIPSIHRSVSVVLPDHEDTLVHHPDTPPHEAAQVLAHHLATAYPEQGHTHWSAHQGLDHLLHTFGHAHPEGYHGPSNRITRVVMHAKTPRPEDVNDVTDDLVEDEISPYRHPEYEVPLHPGAPVHLTGMSWSRPQTGRWTEGGSKWHSDPAPVMHHHTFGKPFQLEAAARWQPSSGVFGPTTGYDPVLFDERHELRPEVRRDIMERLDQALRVDTGVAGSDWQDWLKVYIAGGSASEWAGNRPNDAAQDLDVLIGVNYPEAKRGSGAFQDMDSDQIDTALNVALRAAFNADNVWLLVTSEVCQQPSTQMSSVKPSNDTDREPPQRLPHVSSGSSEKPFSSTPGLLESSGGQDDHQLYRQKQAQRSPSDTWQESHLSRSAGTTVSATTASLGVSGGLEPSQDREGGLARYSLNRSATSSSDTRPPASVLPILPMSMTSVSTPSADTSVSTASPVIPREADRTQQSAGIGAAEDVGKSSPSPMADARTAPGPITGSTTWSAPVGSPWRSTSAPLNSKEASAPSAKDRRSLLPRTSPQITTTVAAQGEKRVDDASVGSFATTAIVDSADSARSTSLPRSLISSERPPAPSGYCWIGPYNLTGFCNPDAYDITRIKPYAAYDVSDMKWAVKPPHLPEHTVADFDPAVIQIARAVASEARAILKLPEPVKTREARALWERLHAERRAAFSEQGEGWQDVGNLVEKFLAYHPGKLLEKIRELALAPPSAQMKVAAVREAIATGVWYHGTPDERNWEHGAAYGIHIGTEDAAREALHARIGRPAEGEWDGTREYGKTLLNRDQEGWSKNQETGEWEPYVRHHPPEYPKGGADYSNGEKIPLNARPSIFPVRIKGPMTNTPQNPHPDWHANGYMRGQIKRGRARSGYYYTNISEDEGSVSAVVPSAAHLERIEREPKTATLSGLRAEDIPRVGPLAPAEDDHPADREWGAGTHGWHHAMVPIESVMPWESKCPGGRHGARCYDADQFESRQHDVAAPEDDWQDSDYVRRMAVTPEKLPALVIHPGWGKIFGGGHRLAAWREAGWTHVPVWQKNDAQPKTAVWEPTISHDSEDWGYDPEHGGYRDRNPLPALYHGTKAEMNPGDHIRAGYPTNYPGAHEEGEDTDWVHATPLPEKGWQHADNAVYEHRKQGLPGTVRHHVYEVKPTGHVNWGEEAYPEDYASDEAMHAEADRMSRHPFEVVRELPYRGEELPFTHKLAAATPEIVFSPDHYGRHAVTARDAAGETLGYLHWHPERGTITALQMTEGNHGKGIATALWRRAHEEAASRGLTAPVHSESRTPAADAWAHSVGGEIPPLSEEARDPDWIKNLPPDAQLRGKTAASESIYIPPDLPAEALERAKTHPHQVAASYAQRETRWSHPRVTMRFPRSDEGGDSLVGSILRHTGYEGDTEGAFVSRHPHPERKTSNPAWLDGKPGVTLHPDAWDYGTVAHEAAHHTLMYAHAIGPNEHQPDEQIHGHEWAGYYARGLNYISPGAGDDFLSHRQHYLEQIAAHHGASKTAAADPPQFTLRHRDHYPYGEGNVSKTREHEISAHGSDGETIGWLRWEKATGRTRGIVVHPDHRRQGIATAMWEEAARYDPPPRHATGRTDEGEGWALSVGARPRVSRTPPELAPRINDGFDHLRVTAAGSDGDNWVTCEKGHEHWGEFGAAGLLIRHRGDDGLYRYLLQKRSPHVDHPNTWSIPSGAIGEDESPEQGARREAREEIGPLPQHLTHHHTVKSTDCGNWAFHTVVEDAGEHFLPRGGGETEYESAGTAWHTAKEVNRLKDQGELHPAFAKSWDMVRRSRGPKTAAAQQKPIGEIGALKSQYPPHTVEEAYQRGEHLHDVADPATGHEITGDEYMRRLRDHLSAHGMQNPVLYGEHDLMQGQHRYAAARDLGWASIPAKPWEPGNYRAEPSVPGWDAPEPKTAAAQAYDPQEDLPRADPDSRNYGWCHHCKISHGDPSTYAQHEEQMLQPHSQVPWDFEGPRVPTGERFYHGTFRQHQPGDALTPGHEGNYGPGSDRFAYFTSHRGMGSVWAHDAIRARNEALGEDISHLRPHVYEVEPTSEFHLDPANTGNYDSEYQDYRTAGPLRVKREVPYDYEPGGGGLHFPKTAKPEYPSMSLAKIKRLYTPDWDEEDEEGTRVRDVLKRKYKQVDPDLERSMRERGQTAPIELRTDPWSGEVNMLGQGHHRVAIADRLGWKSMYYVVDAAHKDTEDPGYEAWRSQGKTAKTAATDGGDHSRSAMIYLDVPAELIRHEPGGVDDHHITLVYLGKDLSDEQFAQACQRGAEAARGTQPLAGVLHGIETFAPSKASDGKIPAFVPAYIPGIGDLRRKLEDLSASEHKDYTPHVTLGYYGEDEPLPPPHPPVKLRFTHLNVKRGDDVVRFPLGS